MKYVILCFVMSLLSSESFAQKPPLSYADLIDVPIVKVEK